MPSRTLRTSIRIERPIAEVFDFFSRAENLGAITPPELEFRIRTPLPIVMRPGTLIDYSLRLHGLPLRWRTRISVWDPPVQFVDEQLRGPYAEWVHTHRFREDGPGATMIDDEVRYRLPFGWLGDVVHPVVRRQLARIFEFRGAAVGQLLDPGAPGVAA
jgi:ligand-binding SRPBCC domain-containing protein